MVIVIQDRKYKNLIGMENFVEFVVSGLQVEAELSRLRLVKFVTGLSYTRTLKVHKIEIFLASILKFVLFLY
jgi:hypothetical protein